jgi:hypothetical protein
LIFIFIFFTFLVSRIRTIIIMASWASIVKSKSRNAVATAIVQENGTRAATTQAATTTQVSIRDQKDQKYQKYQKDQKEIQEQQQMEVFKVHKKYLEELEEEDKKMENRMPLYRYITRPDTHPLFAPIFKDLSEKCQWEQEQWRLNQEYSSMIHDQKVAVWEKKNNWFPVPLMTDVSEAQKKWDLFL